MGDQSPLSWKATRDLMWGAALVFRHVPDRLLHRQRHRTALCGATRLHAQSVLVVCRGNLCRSPYAEHRLRELLQAEGSRQVTIRSAGFLTGNRRPPADVVHAARSLGVDLEGHRSRRLTRDLIRQSDLILAMEPEQQRVMGALPDAPARVMLLGDFDPRPVATRAVPDPYGQSQDVLLACLQRIDRCVQAVASCVLAAPSLVA